MVFLTGVFTAEYDPTDLNPLLNGVANGAVLSAEKDLDD